MKVFNLYDVVQNKSNQWLIEEKEMIPHKVIKRKRKNPILQMIIDIFKAVVPLAIAIFVFLTLSEQLYIDRGGFEVGSEIVFTFILWYVTYKLMNG